MSRPVTVVSLPAPKATSVITNQAVVRNALSKPRSKRSSKKEQSGNNNTLNTPPGSKRKEGQNSGFGQSEVSGDDQALSHSSSSSSAPMQTQRQHSLNSNSSFVGTDKSCSKPSESKKSRAKSGNTRLPPFSSDASDSTSLDPSSSNRRSKNPTDTRSSPKKKNTQSNTNNSSNIDSSEPKRASSSSSNSNSNLAVVSPKKKKQFNNPPTSVPNLSNNASSVSRPRRNKKPPTGVTLRVEPDPEQRDLKEILFPDLYANNRDSSTPQRKRSDKQQRGGVTVRENTGFSAPPQSQPNFGNNIPADPAEPPKSCFAGSSFSNTPDPSALPKPILFGKSSPKSRNSMLDESDDISPSSPNSNTDASSSPPSPAERLTEPESKLLEAKKSLLANNNNPTNHSQSDSDLSQQQPPPPLPQPMQFAQQHPYNAVPIHYPMPPYGMVSPFPIPQNTTMAPMAGPILHGAPAPMAGPLMQAPGMPSPYFYGNNDGGYYMSYPISAGSSMVSNHTPSNIAPQPESVSAPATSHGSMNPISGGSPNNDLANDLKRLLNVHQQRF